MKILGMSLTTLLLIFAAFYLGTRYPQTFKRVAASA